MTRYLASLVVVLSLASLGAAAFGPFESYRYTERSKTRIKESSRGGPAQTAVTGPVATGGCSGVMTTTQTTQTTTTTTQSTGCQGAFAAPATGCQGSFAAPATSGGCYGSMATTTSTGCYGSMATATSTGCYGGAAAASAGAESDYRLKIRSRVRIRERGTPPTAAGVAPTVVLVASPCPPAQFQIVPFVPVAPGIPLVPPITDPKDPNYDPKKDPNNPKFLDPKKNPGFGEGR